MQWIDQNYYDTTYNGTPIEDLDEFTAIANAAERVIDKATQFRLSISDSSSSYPNGFSSYPAVIQNMVLMAISAQIEYFYELGFHTEAGAGQVQSASIGGFSFSNPPADAKKRNSLMSDVAVEYLGYTGLMYRGVDVSVPGMSSRAGFFGDYNVY